MRRILVSARITRDAPARIEQKRADVHRVEDGTVDPIGIAGGLELSVESYLEPIDGSGYALRGFDGLFVLGRFCSGGVTHSPLRWRGSRANHGAARSRVEVSLPAFALDSGFRSDATFEAGGGALFWFFMSVCHDLIPFEKKVTYFVTI